MMGINIEEAIACMALIWVIVSWARTVFKPGAPIQKYLCLKCSVFWGTLAITWNPITAAVASLIAAVVDNYLSNTQITL